MEKHLFRGVLIAGLLFTGAIVAYNRTTSSRLHARAQTMGVQAVDLVLDEID
jgi:hypothetical protein